MNPSAEERAKEAWWMHDGINEMDVSLRVAVTRAIEQAYRDGRRDENEAIQDEMYLYEERTTHQHLAAIRARMEEK